MTALQTLKTIVPPPGKPEGVPRDYDWITLEELAPLSEGYKALLAEYGVGWFGSDFRLNLYTPNTNSIRNIYAATERDRGTQLANLLGGISVPTLVRSEEFFPLEKLGLFLVADTHDGHSLYYRRTADSQREALILYDINYCETVQEFNLSVVDFLVANLSAQISIPGFSEPLRETLRFTPQTTTWNID
jgi:hypothetical protein